MFQLGVPELIVISVTVIASVFGAIIPFWQISKKAGYHPTLGILSAIPLVNVVFFLLSRFRRVACDEGCSLQVPGLTVSRGYIRTAVNRPTREKQYLLIKDSEDLPWVALSESCDGSCSRLAKNASG